MRKGRLDLMSLCAVFCVLWSVVCDRKGDRAKADEASKGSTLRAW